GDGKTDLVVASYFHTVSVLLGNGNGTFQPQATFTAGQGPKFVAVADVNGDGKPDLVVADAYSSAGGNCIDVLLGNGNGTFAARQSYFTGIIARPFSVAVADMNGDGKLDLVSANEGSNSASVLLNSGNGNFTGQAYTIVPPGP